MPQEHAHADPDDPEPAPSSSPPQPPPPHEQQQQQQQQQQQLSPKTLRELVLACGREELGKEEEQKKTFTSTTDRDRLRGQLGFCFEPMAWKSAVAAIADGGVSAMGTMGRTPEGVARYWAWRDGECAREWASTADFVRVEIMGFKVGVGQGEGGFVFFFFSFFIIGGEREGEKFCFFL